MKILKFVGLAILGLIVILLIVAAVMEKSFGAEAKTVINKPKEQVFDYVKYLKNQDAFSKWASIDPEMVQTFSGTDGEVGFVSAWTSNHPDVGVGEQEITAISPDRIDYELRFKEPFESVATCYMTFESTGDGNTQLVWGFNGDMAYPMNVMMLFMDMEGAIQSDLQVGLDNLKIILDSMPEPEPEIEIEMLDSDTLVTQ